MRRSLWSRALSVVFGLWFVLSTAEPMLGAHHCPIHDGGARGTSMQMMAHTDGAPHSAPTHHCTCPGDCCASIGGAMPARPLAIATFAVAAPAERPWITPLYRPAAAEHALPFANGPPSFTRA